MKNEKVCHILKLEIDQNPQTRKMSLNLWAVVRILWRTLDIMLDLVRGFYFGVIAGLEIGHWLPSSHNCSIVFWTRDQWFNAI